MTPENFTFSPRVSGEGDDCTDIEMRSANEKRTIATVDDRFAPLLLAAPKLLAACKLALQFWYSDHPNDTVEGHAARRQIERAVYEATRAAVTGDWQTEYLNAPAPSDAALLRLAERYYAETEAYDRTVCTGPIILGGIMPETHEQRRLITLNAQKKLAELHREAISLGYTVKEFERARQMVGDRSHADEQ